MTQPLNTVRRLTHSNMLAVMSEIVRRSARGPCESRYAEIGRATGIRSGDVAKTVRNMEAWGLVALTQPAPRKSVHIEITPRGQAFRAEALALLFPEAAEP